MLTKNVRGVDTAIDESEIDHTGCNRFTDAMEGENCMTLMELGMYSGGTINNRLVISKHVALVSNRYSKVVQQSASQ